jgi:hypothetical protein
LKSPLFSFASFSMSHLSFLVIRTAAEVTAREWTQMWASGKNYD